jgi:hypothetical protein
LYRPLLGGCRTGGNGSRTGSGRIFARISFSPDAGTERVAIVVDNLGQLPEQRFGLFVCQFKVHTPLKLS